MILETIDADAARSELPRAHAILTGDQIPYIREKVGGMRSDFQVWQKKGFVAGCWEQQNIIAMAVLLANDDEN